MLETVRVSTFAPQFFSIFHNHHMTRIWFVATTVVAMGISPLANAQAPKTKPSKLSALKVAKPAAPKAMSLTTDNQKASYTIGADLGRNLKQNNIPVEIDALIAGLRDASAGAKLALTDDEMKGCMEKLQKSVQEKQSSQNNVIAEKNKEDGEAFLKANASKPGVITTPSGLQYQIIKEGTGPKPLPTDTVTTHYHGTLIDGTVFDSSKERNQPATFPVNGVIQGWQEALPLMNTGSTYKLFIPSGLAYGNRGAGPKIGPNSTLIFDVELISIKGK
jgi:FKBP-type peptidyl-prolyl cis-trans isomerase FklB